MSFAGSSGRMPVSVLAGMAGMGCGSVGGGSSSVRLQNSTSCGSSSVIFPHSPPQLFPQFHQGEGALIRVVSPEGEGSSRASSHFSRVLQQGLRGSEGLRSLEADNRPFHLKSVCGIYEFPHGDSPVGAGVGPTRGLDDLGGSPGCILSDSCASGVQEVSQVYEFHRGSPIQGPLFRFDHSTSGVYASHGPGVSNNASDGVPHGAVSRRLVSFGSVPGRSVSGEGLSTPSLQYFRNQGKSQEESVDSLSRFFLSGDETSDPSFEGFPDLRKDKEAPSSAGGVSICSVSASDDLEKPVGQNVVPVSIGQGFQAENEILTDSPKERLGFLKRRGLGVLDGFLPRGSSVVVRRSQSDPRGTTGDASAGYLPLHRRFRPGLGSIPRRQMVIGEMDSHSKKAVHKLQGVVGHKPSGHRFSGAPKGKYSGVVLRQRHSSIIPQEFRRYEVLGAELPSSADSENVRVPQGLTGAPVCSRGTQCDGRCPQPEQPGFGGRVVPVSGSGGLSVKDVACQCGPFCHPVEFQASGILFSDNGPNGNRGGCDAPLLGQSTDIRVPSFRYDSQGIGETSSVIQHFDDSHSSLLAAESVVSRPVGPSGRGTGGSTPEARSSKTATLPPLPSGSSRAATSCMETIERAARKAGFSKGVARQLAKARRRSTRVNYQYKWATYRSWCRSQGHSISRPTIPKIADFLLFLRKGKHLSYSAIAGYRSVLSTTFRFHLPEISSSSVLADLLKSFRLERPSVINRTPSWDLIKVLHFLRSEKFEPLGQVPLRELTKKTLFLVALATAKRVGELQAISKLVSSTENDLFLSYIPEFQAKTENESNPLPRSFRVKSLSNFVGNLTEELLLCPVRALSIYIKRTEVLLPHPRTLFISPKSPSKPISKNAISFFLREVISQALDAETDPGPSVSRRAHSVRSVATSAAFHRNFSVSSILEAATWKSPSVFTSFYLKDVQFSSAEGFSLGPFVAANCIL